MEGSGDYGARDSQGGKETRPKAVGLERVGEVLEALPGGLPTGPALEEVRAEAIRRMAREVVPGRYPAGCVVAFVIGSKRDFPRKMIELWLPLGRLLNTVVFRSTPLSNKQACRAPDARFAQPAGV